jgi:hypothetical protein
MAPAPLADRLRHILEAVARIEAQTAGSQLDWRRSSKAAGCASSTR